MYRYLTLIDDVKEMMVMMNSLPTCTIIFDKYANVVEMNQLARKSLGIENYIDITRLDFNILDDKLYIQAVISDLLRGHTITNKRLRLKRKDGNTMVVQYNASMLYGLKTVCIFQFFGISTVDNIYQDYLIAPVLNNITELQSNLLELTDKILSGKNESGVNLYQRSTDMVFLLKSRFNKLNDKDLEICKMLTEGKSSKEIASELSKTVSYINSINRRIIHKMNLGSIYELRYYLNEANQKYQITG